MINISDEEYSRLFVYIKQNYGIDLSEKRGLLQSRLQEVLHNRGCKSFSEYISLIRADNTGKLVTEMIDSVTTNYTFFLRDRKQFLFYKNTVLPYIKKRYENEKTLRVWSAACSSGEEAFTLAMINNDFFGDSKDWSEKVLATDICSEVLQKAVSGEYDNRKLIYVPNKWIKRYFERKDNSKSKVCDKIREQVIFKRFNLMDKTFPFDKKFQVIFCRNVMMYFDKETKIQLLHRFYKSLEPGGYLFVGSSEELDYCENNEFTYIKPCVYTKIPSQSQIGLSFINRCGKYST
ncbi:MAG: protein-glutamate O-methyltransferase CheR [Bacillota bacterium]|nr:protein-glutamate O-methyltransferase CheR [Bacillota bacterium]